MIILTGGAGFIGSCFLWKLNKEGRDDIIVVDDLDETPKWRNLLGKRIRGYIQKDTLLRLIETDKAPEPTHVVHMGACSSTMETDADYVMRNNYAYSKTLAEWALKNKATFLYASSAATYGDGAFGYSDDEETTRKLRPLNPYGSSKQRFDLWVLDEGLDKKVTGLKFFNVFGPNEYHKGDMRSIVCKKFSEVNEKDHISLFKSCRSDYKDGEQKRDFIYVKDAIEVMYYFFTHPDATGIFNLGTGVARTWNELAYAMFFALNKKPVFDYVDMPEGLRPRYQYFTEAKVEKLRSAGCTYQFRSLEEGVRDYITYLIKEAYL